MESDSNLFENLTTKTLNTVSGSNIDALTRDIHLEKNNLDALHTTVLVNEATMRNDGGVMPGYGKVVITSGDSARIQFQPEEGEVWLYNGGSWQSTSGTSEFQAWLKDADGNLAFLFKESTSGHVEISPALYGQALYLTNTLFMYVNIASGEGNLNTGFVRVR